MTRPDPEREAVYAPLLSRLASVLVKTKHLAARWGYDTNHLANLRRRKAGIGFVTLPTGGIRYRLSDVIGAELLGSAGPITVDRVCLVIAAAEELSEDERARLIAKVRIALRDASLHGTDDMAPKKRGRPRKVR